MTSEKLCIELAGREVELRCGQLFSATARASCQRMKASEQRTPKITKSRDQWISCRRRSFKKGHWRGSSCELVRQTHCRLCALDRRYAGEKPHLRNRDRSATRAYLVARVTSFSTVPPPANVSEQGSGQGEANVASASDAHSPNHTPHRNGVLQTQRLLQSEPYATSMRSNWLSGNVISLFLVAVPRFFKAAHARQEGSPRVSVSVRSAVTAQSPPCQHIQSFALRRARKPIIVNID